MAYHRSLIRHAEELITSLKWVITAKLTTGENGEISEIHVLARAGSSPKQIVRDIESALYSTLALRIDHKKISVAQMDGEPVEIEPESNGGAPPGRLRFVHLDILAAGPFKCTVDVTLAQGDRLFRGSAKGTSTSKNRFHLAALSTLSGLESFLVGQAAFSLEGLEIVRAFDETVVMVQVKILSSTEERTTVGVCMMDEDPEKACCLAVLNAVNRYLATGDLVGNNQPVIMFERDAG